MRVKGRVIPAFFPHLYYCCLQRGTISSKSLMESHYKKKGGGGATEARAEELKVAGEAGKEGGKDRGRLRPRWGARKVRFPLFLTSHSLSLADIILQYPDHVYFKIHKKIMVLLPPSILFTLTPVFQWPVLRTGPAFLPFIEPEVTEMRPVGWLSF